MVVAQATPGLGRFGTITRWSGVRGVLFFTNNVERDELHNERGAGPMPLLQQKKIWGNPMRNLPARLKEMAFAGE